MMASASNSCPGVQLWNSNLVAKSQASCCRAAESTGALVESAGSDSDTSGRRFAPVRIGDSTPCYAKTRCQGRIGCNAIRFSVSAPRSTGCGWGRKAMPYVDAYGAKLYFEECGHGYPIIFIHEFASDIRVLETQLRHFSRDYRCIDYNARGYPPSDVPEDFASYGWEFAVDDIAAVMRGFKIERAHLVGLSMGGNAALQFGLRYPEKASAIVAASVGA